MASLNTTVGQIDTFLGIRNVLRSERQPKNSLYDCQNVIILDDGSVESRFGYSKLLSLTSVTDGYEHKSLEYGLVVANNQLLSIDKSLGVKVLKTGLTDTKFSWSQVEDRIAYVGETDSGIIVNGQYWLPLKSPFNSAPIVIPQDGDMSSGKYGFIQILRHVETGLEGPPSYPIWYETSSPVAFQIQANNVPAGYVADIYVTPFNDTSFQYLGTATSNILYNCSQLELKNTLEEAQKYTEPMPDGVNALAFHENCLYISVYDQNSNTSIINSSEPFWFNLFKLSEEGFAINGKVIQMMSTTEGLLISTDIGIWLRSNDDSLIRLVDYGVIPSKPIYKDQEGKVIIWTKRGLATFPPYKLVFDKKLSVAPGLECAVKIVNIHGSKYSFVITDTGSTPYNKY